MSDPTIQTFCCHHSGKREDLAIRIMDEFNTDSYNSVCLVSSTVGILGAIYQVLAFIVWLDELIQFKPSLIKSNS